jgi:hypothetical protein
MLDYYSTAVVAWRYAASSGNEERNIMHQIIYVEYFGMNPIEGFLIYEVYTTHVL